MIVPVPQRGRVIPNAAGMAALKDWVESAPDVGHKAARALHIKSLHTRRGIGAKTLGFFWLDVPFRAAGAAVRGGYQPHLSCPVCVTLAENGLSPRGASMGGAAASRSMPAPLPASELVWLNEGNRYLLGYSLTPAYYGIWDREQPGLAVTRFPYEEHGKSEAEGRFHQLELAAATSSEELPGGLNEDAP